MRKNTPKDLWNTVKLPDYIGIDECWEWQGVINRVGYGRFALDGKYGMAHRAAYIAAVGPIPEGMNVLHRCDNRRCCNPAHLFLGTQRENMHDMRAKGRKVPTPVGEDNHKARLTEADVLEIRRTKDSFTGNELAARYNVTRQAIYDVVKRRSWKHI